VKIFFHLTLLTFFFVYLFTITPKITEEAARRRRHQEQEESGKIPSGGGKGENE